MFKVYFQIGVHHIADLAAYDHILFIVALCAVYRLKEWRRILILVTAFTIGHSITLALSALNVVVINSSLIEFLIPVTIVLTALYNVLFIHQKQSVSVGKFYKEVNFKYFIALFFGLIHGMGFSNYFKALLGKESNILLPLFSFNVGIEAGQLIIVSILLTFGFILMDVFKAQQRAWTLFISGAAFGVGVTMMIKTWPF